MELHPEIGILTPGEGHETVLHECQQSHFAMSQRVIEKSRWVFEVPARMRNARRVPAWRLNRRFLKAGAANNVPSSPADEGSAAAGH